MNPIPEMTRTQRWLQLKEEGYEAACTDIRRLRDFVKLNDRRRIFPSTLPPKTQMPQPAEGEKIRCQDALEYLRALITELEQLTNMLPRLVAGVKRSRDGYEEGLEFARCVVRLKELNIDWELETMAYEQHSKEGKELLRELPSQEYLTDDEKEYILSYRGEIRVWDEGFPALKRAWDELGERQLIPTNI